MNKFKKLAMTAVAVVMAGSMAFSIAACGGNDDPNKDPNKDPNGTTGGKPDANRPYLNADDDTDDTIVNVGTSSSTTSYTWGGRGEAPTLPANLTPKTDADGKLSYTSKITLNTSLGYEKVATGITYGSEQIQALAGNKTASSASFVGGTYVKDDLKPAWQALTKQLDITISDTWVTEGGKKASAMIGAINDSAKTLADYTLITASADTISTEQAEKQSFLNINDYLYYMPNYKAFLEANPVVRLSLTDNASTGAMYMLPYFDGNDDIEKYVLMRKDIVEKLLDATDLSAATGTFASQAEAKNGATGNNNKVTVVGTKASVESYMGQTGNYKIDVTDPSVVKGTNKSEVADADSKKTVTIRVDYSAALNAAKDEGTALGAAVKAAAGKVYNGGSGNIVDLQNFAINETNGAVTGAQLTKILQEYIKVAYHKTGETTPFYTKLSDVFNSAYAAWDVDLYVAYGRCAMTSLALLGNSVRGEGDTYFLASRLGSTNRTYDIASMAGELYGVRGLTSRFMNMYAYIDNAGEVHDARADEDMWDALAKMSNLAKEGLYYTGDAMEDGTASIAGEKNAKSVQFLSSTDYVQTQTAKGGFVADGTITGDVEDGYNYAPILTPVSAWDVDGDGVHEKVMRFTESWRGVKDGGFCVPVENVKGNPEKLAAVLAFIDYFYSNDGQILMTYGPQSTNGNVKGGANGTWYATKASKTLEQAKTDGIVDSYDGVQYFVKDAYKGQYFCYNNELYTGTYYKGKQIPTLTTDNLDVFYNISGQNFTNHARYYIGSCLNLGVKDQGFEYQCTSSCGIVGSDIVSIALVNGTINHTLQTIDTKNLWYTLTPTVFPFAALETSAMKDQYKYVSGKGDDKNFFYANSKCYSNLLTDIMYYGYDKTKTINVVSTFNLTIPENAKGIINMLSSTADYGGLTQVDGYLSNAWKSLLVYYTTLTK